MADTPLSPSPATRRRLLVVSKIINQAGQYEPLEVRLPDSALRVTGLSASTTPLPGRDFQRRDAFVIFADYDPNNPGAVGTAQVSRRPNGQQITLARLPLYQVLNAGLDMADGLAAYDPQRHVGFYQALTDELPVQPLPPVPAGKRLCYAQTVPVGLPKLVNALGQPLDLVVEAGYDVVPTLLSRSVTDPNGRPGYVYETRAYLCRADPPAPRPADPARPWLGSQQGYYNGILFPGDPNRF